jgi:hypothetical protein
MYAARLWPFVSGFLCESNLGTDFEIVEIGTYNTITMEKYLTSVTVGDGAVIVWRKNLRNPAVRWCVVRLDVAALFVDFILQLPTNRIERIAHSNVNVFVCMMLSGATVGDNFFAQGAYVDSDVIDIALVVMFVRGFNCDSTAGYFAEETLQSLDMFPYFRFDCSGRFKILKLYLQRYLHGFTLC